ncbi:MAG TPA: cation diffusion facilitator family transporter [Vicinamibacterales bacterium]|nr:cation diffusion facilitator family transporter [Vicinamibacterales bacterium]
MSTVVVRNPEERRLNQRAMRLSLAVGFAMLAGKAAAYVLTGSAAIMSDALESVIHVLAVAFAAFSLSLSAKPADSRFPYGYERIAFFSAGFEGALIILAAASIIWTAVARWLHGLQLERLGTGVLLVLAASVVNGALGWHLVRTGRRSKSIILEANGRHVLTDCWTSLGVVVGLLLVMATGWLPFDPIVAIAVAVNILWSGAHLVFRSVSGLMDYADPARTARVTAAVEPFSRLLGFHHHGLRVRHTGHRTLVEIHLLFPFSLTLGDAHRRATVLEAHVANALGEEVEVITHLESLEDHAAVHGPEH